MYAQPTSSGFSGRARSNPDLSESIVRLLGSIDARRADSDEECEAIFRLRYDAYRREGVIPANPSATFSDAYDRTPNAYLIGLYIEGKLASSIRIHVASREYPDCPTLEVFPEILQPQLDAGKIIIDPTRFVADEGLSRLHVGLPHATLRLCRLAAEYFHADLALAAVRVEHQAFYRRAFNYQLLCEPRPYPLLAKPISLMAIHYPTAGEVVHRGLPFLRSTYAERRMLFERNPRAERQGEVPLQDKLAPFVEFDSKRAPG
jgi:N-acyl-L-homoserine lactone synthetase